MRLGLGILGLRQTRVRAIGPDLGFKVARSSLGRG